MTASNAATNDPDKQWIAIDTNPASSFFRRIYAMWTLFVLNPSVIYESHADARPDGTHTDRHRSGAGEGEARNDGDRRRAAGRARARSVDEPARQHACTDHDDDDRHARQGAERDRPTAG